MNDKNNLRYIGITRMGAKRRFQRHVAGAFWQEKRPRSLLQKAIAEIGAEHFRFEIISFPRCWLSARLAERKAIAEENTLFPWGYNNTKGGDGIHGFGEPSDEVKQRISRALLGRKLSDEQKAKVGAFFKGRPLTPEHREKIGNAQRGQKRPSPSEETRAKLSAAGRGQRRPHTERQKQLLRESAIIRSKTPEGRAHIAKIVAARVTQWKGSKHSAKAKALVGEAKRKWHAERRRREHEKIGQMNLPF